jgi:hypothetical protein
MAKAVGKRSPAQATADRIGEVARRLNWTSALFDEAQCAMTADVWLELLHLPAPPPPRVCQKYMWYTPSQDPRVNRRLWTLYGAACCGKLHGDPDLPTRMSDGLFGCVKPTLVIVLSVRIEYALPTRDEIVAAVVQRWIAAAIATAVVAAEVQRLIADRVPATRARACTDARARAKPPRHHCRSTMLPHRRTARPRTSAQHRPRHPAK